MRTCIIAGGAPQVERRLEGGRGGQREREREIHSPSNVLTNSSGTCKNRDHGASCYQHIGQLIKAVCVCMHNSFLQGSGSCSEDLKPKLKKTSNSIGYEAV